MRYLFVALLILAAVAYASSVSSKNEAEFMYGVIRADCVDAFKTANFSGNDCLAITISKILGFAIIGGALVVKFPQIIAIFVAKSGQGIVLSMFYLECLCYMIAAFYNIHIGTPFSVWGENLFLFLQSSICVLLIWTYDEGYSVFEKVIVFTIGIGVSTYLYLDYNVPDHIWGLMNNIGIGAFVYSRIPQIIENFRSKSTGTLSIITFGMTFLGAAARLFTVMMESGDTFLLVQTGLGFVFNFIISFQIILYWGNTAETKSDEAEPTKANKPASKNKKKKIE